MSLEPLNVLVPYVQRFLFQCEKWVDPDSGVENQPACDLRAVGKKFDKGLYTTLVSREVILIIF